MRAKWATLKGVDFILKDGSPERILQGVGALSSSYFRKITRDVCRQGQRLFKFVI